MVLGFKKQFVEPIMMGTKIHTIRADEKDRWHPGMKMHQATGTRTKYYNCFNETTCVSTERIWMTLSHILEISVGDRYLYLPDKELLARNDGFKDFKEFEDWWIPVLKENGDEYGGKIIHWTPFRYDQ